MIRSDYALHLSRMGKTNQAKHELNKALLADDKQPTIHKNLGAVYARTGDYVKAQEHAQTAYLVNPDDPMNRRNYARCLNMNGSTQAALDLNLQSVEMETASRVPVNTSALRSAAVQTLSRGKPQEEALALVRTARIHDGVSFRSETEMKTNEIIHKILTRRGDRLGVEKVETSKEQTVAASAKKAAERLCAKLDALDFL